MVMLKINVYLGCVELSFRRELISASLKYYKKEKEKKKLSGSIQFSLLDTGFLNRYL